MDVFHDLLAAFDITPEDAEQLDSPLGNYRPQGSAIPPDDFYVELSAYGLSVEVPNAEFCGRMHHALAEHYGFTEEQLAEEFRKYVGHAARTPGGLTRLRE
jgi:hypothetical protein